MARSTDWIDSTATGSKYSGTSQAEPNSLGGVYVRSLFIDHSGTLWIGCDQSLDKFDPITETFTHFRIGGDGTVENDGPANNISEGPDGKLWLATAKGLFVLDSTNGHMTRYTHDPNDPSTLGSNGIHFSHEDRRGTFWVANEGGLDAFDRKAGKVTEHIPWFTNTPFTFHEDRLGLFWVARDSPECPLAVLDRKQRRLTCYQIYEGGVPYQQSLEFTQCSSPRTGQCGWPRRVLVC